MMQNERAITRVAIVGGGSAGWMTAAMLATVLARNCQITLVESDAIGTVGVGEATIPPIRIFNQSLGLGEAEFLAATKGTYKLGIEFVGWGSEQSRYFHPFGPHGRAFDTVGLHHYWLAARAEGETAPLHDHSMAWALASAGKFAAPSPDPRSVMSTFDYAYHFDAGLYAACLRSLAEKRGVTRMEGKIADVALRGTDGFVEAVTLEDGREIAADLFIDCSGFAGLLIEGALHTGYDDWSNWLPCDRAVAMPCAHVDGVPPAPYTRSTAREAGWQWRIPLQHRVGNGYVYCSEFMDDARAADLLSQRLDGAALGDPRPLRFTAGRRRLHWNRNVVAIGLSSGFLEPLESTSLHLIQANIAKLIALFPTLDFDSATRDEFNRIALTEMERIRDFIILHYKLNSRQDGALWRHVAAMDIPDTLALKIEHFSRHGRLIARDLDLFAADSWLAVHVGQGNLPAAPDPLLAYRGVDGRAYLAKLRAAMQAEAQRAPTHGQALARALAHAAKAA